MKLKHIYISFFILTVIFYSCKKGKPYWDADFVAPITSSSLNLTNLFPDTLLTANANGSLKIAIESNVFSYNADSLLKLPDTTIYNYFGPLLFPGSYFTYFPGQSWDMNPQNEVTFSLPNGVKLKEAVIRSGKLRIKVKNPLRQVVYFTCNVTSATKNGSVLNIVIPMPAGTAVNPSITDTLVDVSGYKLNFAGISGAKSNTVVQNLTFQIAPTASPDTLKYGDTLKSYITFVNLIPDFGRGYFGSQTLQVGPDTTVFDVFNQLSSGTLGLDSTEIKLIVTNEFGIDMRSMINSLKSINPQNSTISLAGPNVGTPFNIGRATATGNPILPVIPVIKTFTFNQSNSTITQFIGNLPKAISYDLNAQINPLGNLSGFNDFIYYGTSLGAKMQATIPLRFSANNIVLRDTSVFNASVLEKQFNNINEGFLLLRATNSYPFSLKITGILLDATNNAIETLISAPGNIIEAPSLDANNMVISPKESFIKLPFDKGVLSSLLKAKKICYYIEFNTPNSPVNITFYNNYKLDLLLTADVNYSINK